MFTTARLVGFLSMAAVFTSAHAQSTLGELLDSGGKKMTKEQLVGSLGGTKYGGGLASGRAILNIELKTDGTIAGSVAAQGRPSGTTGQWAVDDAGKTCIDVRMTSWNLSDRGCVFFYSLGETTYRTLNESEDRSTQLVKYVMAK